VGLLAVDAALLREVLLPGLTLTPGRVVAARVVAADAGAGGRLAIAGFVLDAELPRELATGATVRLEVRDVNDQRVLLSVAHDPAPAPAPLPQGAELPGGARLTVMEDEEGSQERSGGRRPGARTLSLQLEMPRLGTLELRFELDPAALRAAVAVAPGEPLTRAREHAPALREALTEAAGRPVAVSVTARREPLEIYA
jgi:hypothetical protein